MTDLYNLGDLTDRTLDLDRVAIIDLIDAGAPRKVSHRELDELAGGVAHLLKDAGLQGGDRVAILSLNRTEYLAAYFGIMRAGLVAVPVNIKLAAAAIAHVLEDSNITFAFVDNARRAMVPSSIPVVDFDGPGPDGFASRVQPRPFETVRPAADEVAQILYTSGSTGMPKGVPLTHAGQLWALCRPLQPAAEQERYMIAQPLFHMNGLMMAKGVVRSGASVVMMPAFETRTYAEALAHWQVTSVLAVPTMFARVIKEIEGRDDLDFSALHLLILSSAPITLALAERIGAAFPAAVVEISYGTTEAGARVFGPHPLQRPRPPLALGIATDRSEVRLIDGPSDDEGVLVMRNPAVMHGYLNLPEKTGKVLQDGWYYSGDVMRRDADGYYFFVGRADDMFVCSGENIYPGEVEKMMEKHPDVQQAVVVPLPDEERSQVPVAFVVLRGSQAVTVDELKRFAIANGPAYQHPRRIAFLGELPWAGTNKIDRNALLNKARELETAQAWSV
jgi:acyl-CoA synthetase (AMP-forming)/AMP-acid ligase II